MTVTDVALSATNTQLVEDLTIEIATIVLAPRSSVMLAKFTLKVTIGAHDDLASPSAREAIEAAIMASFVSNSGRIRSIHIHRPSFENDGGPAGENTRRVVRVTVKTPRDLA